MTTNIIRHTMPVHAALTLEVEIEMEPFAVRLRVEDDGAAFDPTLVPDKASGESAQEAGPGGYGLRIIRSTATQLDYRRFGGLNVLEMRVPRLV